MNTLAPLFLLGPSFLQDTMTFIKVWMSKNINQFRTLTTELHALARLEKSVYNVVNTLAPSFFILSS